MRSLLIALAALAPTFLFPLPVRAGVYNTEEPIQFQLAPDNDREFAALLGDIRRLAVEMPVTDVAPEASQNPKRSAERPTRAAYLKRIAVLEERERHGLITNEERVNLAAYLLRVGRYDQAERVLVAIPSSQRNFLAWSNLASAYQLTESWDRAESCLDQALKSWPIVYAGWTWRHLNGFRRVEKYHLALIQSRLREARLGGARPRGLDAIFPRVRFVGPGGKYEAGTLDAEQSLNLPAEDLMIVKQLLLWFPFDDRLYWLYGELVNARGRVSEACEILDYVFRVRKNTSWTELKHHRRVLLEQKDISDTWAAASGRILDEYLRSSAIMLDPRLPPGANAILSSSGFLAAFDKVQNEKLSAGPAEPVTPDTEMPAATPSSDSTLQVTWWTQWPYLLVSFLAGAAMTTLFNLQLREIRRRRERTRRV